MKYLCDNCSPKIGCTNRFENKKTECDSYVPMNNEQFIRFCNTEQLAELLLRFYYQDYCMNTKRRVIEWLKQPHKEN